MSHSEPPIPETSSSFSIAEDPEFIQAEEAPEPPFEIPFSKHDALDDEQRIPKTLHLWIIFGLGLIVVMGLLIQSWLSSSRSSPESAPKEPLKAINDSPPSLAPLQAALNHSANADLDKSSPESIHELMNKSPGQLPKGDKRSPEDLRQYEIDRSQSLIAGSKILALNHGSHLSLPETVGQVMTSLTQALPGVIQNGQAVRQMIVPPSPAKPENRIPALSATAHTPGPLLLEGSAIPCVLLSEVRSDLPGMIVAQVSEDIFDSDKSTVKLIPKGARLIGRYDTRLTQGQQRLMASFHRLILPNGTSVLLDKMEGADLGGGAGLSGDVNTHFWARFGQAFLIAGLAKATEPSNGTSSNNGIAPLVGPNAAGQILIDTSRMNLQVAGAMQPTITLARGEPFLVMVNRDLSLPEIKDALP